jgi:predicted MFS family arabinose efflux permease
MSYVGAPPKLGATLQGIIHSLHIGLGRGIGGLFGGMILLHYGFDVLFRSFSLTILVVVAIVFLVRYHRKDEVEPIWSKLWNYSPIAPHDTLSDNE